MFSGGRDGRQNASTTEDLSAVERDRMVGFLWSVWYCYDVEKAAQGK